MSEFVEVEWFGREDKIGIVLTYDQHDGFKARMAPLPKALAVVNDVIVDLAADNGEEFHVKWLMANAAKIPFDWAWRIWSGCMVAEWENKHLAGGAATVIRYDHRDYDVKTLEEIR